MQPATLLTWAPISSILLDRPAGDEEASLTRKLARVWRVAAGRIFVRDPGMRLTTSRSTPRRVRHISIRSKWASVFAGNRNKPPGGGRQRRRRREEEYHRGAEENPATREPQASGVLLPKAPRWHSDERSRLPAEYASRFRRMIRQAPTEYPQATAEYKQEYFLEYLWWRISPRTPRLERAAQLCGGDLVWGRLCVVRCAVCGGILRAARNCRTHVYGGLGGVVRCAARRAAHAGLK